MIKVVLPSGPSPFRERRSFSTDKKFPASFSSYLGASKAVLPPGLVKNDRNRIG